METATTRWLDALAVKLGSKAEPASDYRIAQVLGITRSAVSQYRNHAMQMDDDVAAHVAELLEAHPLVIIGQIRAERSRSERAKKVWAQAAYFGRKYGNVAAVILSAGLSALGVSIPSEKSPLPSENNPSSSIYYVKYKLDSTKDS